MFGMGSKPNTEVTAGAKLVMDYCKRLQVKSGLNAVDFAKKCGMGQNYWYVRARYDAPLTMSDCEHIARANNMSLRDLFRNALGSSDSEHIDNISQTTGGIAVDPRQFDIAANMDPNRDIESETPDD